MFKISYNHLARVNRTIPSFVVRFNNNFSSAPSAASIKEEGQANKTTVKSENKASDVVSSSKKPNHLVAAAFAALKPENPDLLNGTPLTAERISKAQTVDELLSIAEGAGISRKSALKVVSILAQWSTVGKIEPSEFESDSRFIRLLKILTKGNQKTSQPVLKSEDLATIASVTADDEAAKLVSAITLPQMVKVMNILNQKKRRSTPLLRSLAFNIAKSTSTLNLKQCADLLYCSGVLNFIDQNCLEKIISDISICLQSNIKGSAVIGSILTSLGILRYKNTKILDDLSEWILQNHSICRMQDLVSLFVTLGVLNHQPVNAKDLYKVLIPQLNNHEVTKPTNWLDVVWSLVILKQATSEHINSVLSQEFVEKLSSIASKLKLLNINAASQLLIKNYEGARLQQQTEFGDIVLLRSKEKELMVTSVQDTLSNFLNPATHFKTNINTGMGFYIDAEIALDKDNNFLPINKDLTSKESSDVKRIAVLVHDYHDFTHDGSASLIGLNELIISLLKAQKYYILTVPHTEYNLNEKLVTKVKYLQTKLKNIA